VEEKLQTPPIVQIITVVSSVLSAIGITGGFVLWLSGAFAGATIAADKLRSIEQQVTGLSNQVQRMQDQLNAAPRVDQLAVLDRHLSAEDGRMDGIDTRLRDLEQRISRGEARQDVLDRAAAQPLRSR
jgi:hypothetical protein